MIFPTYIATGSTAQFDITFPYLDPTHVKAKVDGFEVTFTWVNSTRIELDVTPAAGAEVKPYRNTPVDEDVSNFTDGAVLSADDLTRADTYLRYHQEEVEDRLQEIEELTSAPQFEALHGDPTDNTALAAALADKADANHAHTMAEVDDLVATLASKLDDSQASATGLSLLGAANAAAATALLNAFTSTLKGLVPAPGAGVTTTFLRADGSWATPATEVGAVAFGAITGNATDNASLATALGSKASAVHGHDIADVTGLTAALAGKEPAIAAGGAGVYFAGDKTWQALNKAAVGLGNADNTSDANKPVSTAQAAAINAGRLCPVTDSAGDFTVGGADTEEAYRYTGTGGNTATISNSLATNAMVTVYNDGTGNLSIAAGAGVTLVNVAAANTTAFSIPPMSCVTVHKVAAGRIMAAPSKTV